MSGILSDKYENKYEISPKKTKASSDDLVHQENESVSSDDVQQKVDIKKGCQYRWQN